MPQANVRVGPTRPHTPVQASYSAAPKSTRLMLQILSFTTAGRTTNNASQDDPDLKASDLRDQNYRQTPRIINCPKK